ncbi:MAG: UDP-N-acetylglucosamine 4,6-dehydratase (inverting) [Silvibacterium sp.]
MCFQDKVVLVTGGTGSFGKKFVEHMLKHYKPRKLIVFSRDELKQHEMRLVFPDSPDSPIRYFLGDVRDRERLYRAFSGVDIIVHAAALKQVPACEYNPFEAVQTNILGAKNVIDAAIDCGVSNVLAISTDKAVNPVNLYGATKLCAEKIFIQANSYSGRDGCRFSCSRYGNVVGSRGSVVPVFLEQRKTGVVTITDERMTRFWITLDQGVSFVTSCIEEMRGGEIFVPKIPSMRLTELAKAVAPQCDTRAIGIRPGEKLHETLVSEDEARHTVETESMFVIQPAFPWWDAQNWQTARPLAEGFSYASDTNDDWLTTDQFWSLFDEHSKTELSTSSDSRW